MATGRIGTTPVLTTRWSKAPAAGTTSLSGLDDNSVSLVYSVGYEAVYQNGVLLSRGNDYTATNGTTITLTTATVAGDIIEVFANQTIPLTDTYSQTVANGKFINNTLTTTTGDIIYASAANTPARLGIGSTGQVLGVSGGVPAWTTPSSGAMTYVGGGTFSSVNSVSASANVFSSTYANYFVMIDFSSITGNSEFRVRFRASGSDTTSGYEWALLQRAVNGVTNADNVTGAAYIVPFYVTATSDRDSAGFYVSLPQLARQTKLFGNGFTSFSGTNGIGMGGGVQTGTTQFDSITFYLGTGVNMTGTYRIYGIANS